MSILDSKTYKTKKKRKPTRRKTILTTPEKILRNSVMIVNHNGPQKIKASIIKSFPQTMSFRHQEGPPSPESTFFEDNDPDWIDWNDENENTSENPNNIDEYPCPNEPKKHSNGSLFWINNSSKLLDGILFWKYGYNLTGECCDFDPGEKRNNGSLKFSCYDCPVRKSLCLNCFEV